MTVLRWTANGWNNKLMPKRFTCHITVTSQSKKLNNSCFHTSFFEV